MVLEMKRALEDLKKGADGAYRKIYDATYEEVYCKSFLITQEEKQALSLVEDFYAGVLKEIGEALKAEDQNLWFWQQYYKKIRREYQKLLSVQHKEAPGKAQNLAQILAALPLLHRVMLVMAYEDDFSAEQISAVLGLASEKIEGELEKLEKILPTLAQGQPQENAVWLAGWKTILAGADRQILGTVAVDWVDVAYEKASAAAGVKEQPKKEDNFEYFVADVDLTEEKPKKKKAEPVIEEEDDEDEEEEEVVKPIVEKEEQVVPNPVNEMQYTRPESANQNNYMPNYNTREIENTNMQYYDVNLDSLLSGNKKVVAFVGTSKNGTSFLVNNLADVLSKKGINVAVLDLTQNKNAYYIYTKNEEELRRKAYSSIQNLARGAVDGIQVNKNLTVFTTLPGEDEGINEYGNILKTLVQNYSVVLMDCDFETNYGYFKNAQEIYLVQSFDILTIQPLTAFLRNLKSKNILDPQKLRVVLNKVLRVRSVTERTIIGGMAYYNDPAMSFMTELFDKDNVKYCSIPFEEQTYSRYLEGLVNCEISINGYSKNFLASLDKLSNMVYPLLSNSANSGKLNSYNSNGFSSNMNNTLNKMKNNY